MILRICSEDMVYAHTHRLRILCMALPTKYRLKINGYCVYGFLVSEIAVHLMFPADAE